MTFTCSDAVDDHDPEMSLGLSKSDVAYLQCENNAMNLNTGCGDNLLNDNYTAVTVNNVLPGELNSGTLQQLPTNLVVNDLIVKNGTPEDNNFVHVSGESSSLGVVTLKTGPDANNGNKIELVSTPTSTSSVNCVTSATNAIAQIDLAGMQNLNQVCVTDLNNVQTLPGSLPIAVDVLGAQEILGSKKFAQGVPIQVMTTANDPSVYVLAVTIEDPQDGKKIEDAIYTPVTTTQDKTHDVTVQEGDFNEPQRTSTPKSPDEEVHPLDETIIAGNVPLMSGNTEKLADDTQEKEASLNQKEKCTKSVKHETVQSQLKKEVKRNLDFGGPSRQINIPKEADEQKLQSEDIHNETYCRNWVQQSATDTGNGDISQIENAQSDLDVEKNDSTLLDVTSVSRNVPEYRGPKHKLKKQTSSNVTKNKPEAAKTV